MDFRISLFFEADFITDFMDFMDFVCFCISGKKRTMHSTCARDVIRWMQEHEKGVPVTAKKKPGAYFLHVGFDPPSPRQFNVGGARGEKKPDAPCQH